MTTHTNPTHTTTTDYAIEFHNGNDWQAIGYRRPTADEARIRRDARREDFPNTRFRIVEWTAAARVIETDEAPADAGSVTA